MTNISNLITYEGLLFYVTNLFYKKIMLYLFAYPYDEQTHTSTAVVESGRRTQILCCCRILRQCFVNYSSVILKAVHSLYEKKT